MAGNPVGVEGLAELRRALHDVDKALPKKLRTRFKKIGDEVAAEARSHVPVKTGRARNTIRSGASGTTAYVAGGRATVPYYGWLEYGGVLKPVGGRHNTIRRARVKGGRYLYPAVDRRRGQIEREAQAAFQDAAREVGFTRR